MPKIKNKMTGKAKMDQDIKLSVRFTLIQSSPLVQHMVDLFESFYFGETKTIMINNWK